jgi:hypothetical protein
MGVVSLKDKPAWSFSSLKGFLTCAKQYYHLRVAKDYVSGPTTATTYGVEFHTACENYVRDGTELEARFAHVKPVLDALRKISGEKLCELKMALNKTLEPCAFFDKECFLRGIADLIILKREKGVAYYVDYKTGKSSAYADAGQLEIMAMMIFATFPEIKKVKGMLLFVVPGHRVEEVYLRKDRKVLWANWLGKYSQLQAAHKTGIWNARPSGLCRQYCPVTECAHHG